MRSLPRRVREILEMATRAPSGENAQPWHFTVTLSDPVLIDIDVSSSRNQSLYGWGNRASCVAIGAALENISIAASHRGFRAVIALLPDSDDLLRAARVRLIDDDAVAQDPLEPFIVKRVTNRKIYSKKSLSESERKTLQKAAAGYGEVRFTTNPEDMKTLAGVGSYNERIMLGNPILHAFFFNHVNWTKAADDARKVGFFIDTLELPAPAKVGFKIMSHWRSASVLNRLAHFNAFVGAQNAKTYASSGAFGIIISPRDSPRDALEAGRVTQRLWLEATRLGLSLQPVVGLLYFSLRVRSGATDGFSAADLHLIETGYLSTQEIFNLQDAVPYFMFRIGHADPPSARSVRFSVDEVTTIKP